MISFFLEISAKIILFFEFNIVKLINIPTCHSVRRIVWICGTIKISMTDINAKYNGLNVKCG